MKIRGALVALALAAMMGGASHRSQAENSSGNSRGLSPGDVRLPSGAVVRVAGAAPSAAAAKEQIRDQFVKFLGQKEVAPPAGASEWTFGLEVKGWDGRNSLKAVCDEYVGYALQPLAKPMAANLGKVRITLESHEPRGHETCEYGVKDRLGFVADGGVTLPRRVFAFEALKLAGLKPVGVVPLAERKGYGVSFSVQDYLTLVPAQDSRAELGRYLMAIGQKMIAPDEKAVRLIAVAGSADRYRLPGYAVTAFRGADGGIVLIEDIRFGRMMRKREGAGETFEFAQLTLFNVRLAEILANAPDAMKAGGAGAQYMAGALYDDALAAFEAAGREMAENFGVSHAVVFSRTPLPGSANGLQIPIELQRDGDKWKVVKPQK